MKTNFTQLIIIRIILFILICLYSILVFGQSEYNFKTAIHKTDFIFQINSQSSLNNLQTRTHKNAGAAVTNELSGVVMNGKVNLQWSFETDNNISTVVLERGNTPNSFRDRAIFWLNFDGSHKSDFKYTDTRGKKKSAYYRLKIIAADGEVYYSNLLHFTGKKQDSNGVKAG